MNRLQRSVVVRVGRSTNRPAFVWDRPRVWMERLEPRYLYAASIDILGTSEHIAFTQPISDGKVLVAGEVFRSFLDGPQIPEKGVLFRLNADLSADASFGENGVVYFNDSWMISSAAEFSDGSIIAIGQPFESPGRGMYDAFRVYKLTPDGTLDPSFDGDGVVTVSGLRYSSGYRLREAAGGKILIGLNDSEGAGVGADNGDGHIFRLNADGSRDSTFGQNGQVVVDAYRRGIWNLDELLDMTVLPDGRIIAAVSYLDRFDTPGGTTQRYEQQTALVALRADGSFDSAFGDAGSILLQTSGAPRSPQALIEQADDGSVYLLTTTLDPTTGGNVGYEIRKFDAAGTPDATFGTGGRVTRSLDNQDLQPGEWYSHPSSMRFANDKLIVAFTAGVMPTEGDKSPLSTPHNMLARTATFSADGQFLGGQRLTFTTDGAVGPGGSTFLAITDDGSIVGVTQVTDYEPTADELKLPLFDLHEATGLKRMAYARLFAARFGDVDSPVSRDQLPPAFPDSSSTPPPPAFPDAPQSPSLPPEAGEPGDPSEPSSEPAEPPTNAAPDDDATPPVPGAASNAAPPPFAAGPTIGEQVFEDDEDLLSRVEQSVL